MLNIINGKNYHINLKLFWGSDGKDVESTLDSNKNVAELGDSQINVLDIVSSLSNPFFHGSIVYSDQRNGSSLRNVVDMPIVYGILRFSVVNGNDLPGSENVPAPYGEEDFCEEIFVTGFNTYDDHKSEYIKVKIDFISIDYLKFISNISNVSTFDGFDKNSKPVADVLTELFGAAELGDKFDKDSVTVNVEIPYISTENDTLLSSLDYIYRKIFDFDFKESDGKTYCRIIYDHVKRKYRLWKFDDAGTKKSVDTKINDQYEKSVREEVSVDSLAHGNAIGLNSSAYVKSSGNQSNLFEIFDKINFVDYDYKTNEFTKHVKEKNDEKFVEHDDEFDSDMTSKSKLVLNNAKYFKKPAYEKSFTTSRQNGSMYDIFTDAIFKSSFLRVNSEGSIGRKAGDGILLTFNDFEGTLYEHLNGDYIITGIINHYEKNGENGIFRSIMDVYRPYTHKDSVKSKMTY